MSTAPTESLRSKSLLQSLPFYYGWVIVVLSALAMLATLPGRTHGLGLITERLLSDPTLHLERLQFGKLNFWATMLGAAFCLPCGRLIDRVGSRLMLTAVTAGLGIVVLAMTQLTGIVPFFIALVLTRGLGQSALSVISLAMVGKWFSQRLSLAMGVYTVLMALGFISAYQIVGRYGDAPWQTVWSGLGYALLLGIAPLGWLFVRNTPEACQLPVDGTILAASESSAPATGSTVRGALAEPAFWAFALATSVYGLVSSGASLFNQDILAERGFPTSAYYTLLKVSTGLGLAGNFLAGWLVQWTSLRRVMGISLTLLAAALVWMPQVSTMPELYAYAFGMAFGGGMMTVVFFTSFGQVFGRLHLGQIQGIAQLLTVFASALGPVLLAYAKDVTGSYMPFFYASAAAVAALGVWTCFLKLPAPRVMPQ
ncbi:MAG: MFS transporter [Planctomycetes bacterium]|nr:MFS transporter [Planctomycetota bacterium]